MKLLGLLLAAAICWGAVAGIVLAIGYAVGVLA